MSNQHHGILVYSKLMSKLQWKVKVDIRQWSQML